MAEEYTPTTGEVRSGYAREAEFDRWLAQVRAEALRGFARWAQESDPAEHPLLGLDEMVQAARDYADRIEGVRGDE
jgi:hypothetical protein